MTVIEVKENGAIRTKMLSCDSPFFVPLYIQKINKIDLIAKIKTYRWKFVNAGDLCYTDNQLERGSEEKN